MLRLDWDNPADTALTHRFRGGIAAVLWVAAGLGAAMPFAVVAVAADASEIGAPNQHPSTDVLGGPVADNVDDLQPLPLRREISRVEGRISDLRKSRTAELAALDAALAAAQTAAKPPAAHAADDGERASSASDATLAERLRDADTHSDRRREIEERYAELLAEAEARMKRLLDRQAQIDPEAPDQRRLRNAGSPDTAAHWP